MNFLNQPLAWGALAFSIPLILHIMNRSRFRRVEWGAMHLLESVVKVNHKRFKLEQLLLLLVRCCIPALLAFCLANPVIKALNSDGEAPVSLVILLDTSYSMDATSNGIARFEEAVAAACDLVDATTKGSEIAVIQTGGSATPLFDQPVFDGKAVTRRLRTLQGGYGASDMQQALDAGIATLAGMSHARRELILISDFQPADWNGAADIPRVIQQQVAAMEIPPELTLLPVGEKASGNVSIESLDFSSRPLGVGQQLAVRANLRNHDAAEVQNVRVTLKLDGVEQSVTQVNLAANTTTQTLFPCEFETPGSHVIEVELTVSDSLKTDNSFAAAVAVWDQINVVMLDGDPSSQPLKSETDFLSVALTPYTFGRLKLADLVQTETITDSRHLTPERLADTKVLVLANVSKLKEEPLQAIQQFVTNGGALLVFAGNRIETKWYNQTMFASSGLLPAEFGAPRGKIDDNGSSAHIVAQHFDHPALQFFNDSANGDLSTAEIRQWYELKLPSDGSMILTSTRRDEGDTTTRGASPAVIARLDTGEPLMVERKFGDGVVVQVGTSCDADWSDLPLRPYFVPMMQQLVTTMATQLNPPRNISTGEAAVALFGPPPGEDDDKPSPSSALSLSVVTPEGSRRTLQAIPEGNQLMARFDGTRRPGVYTMTSPDAKTIHFVASTSRGESDLSQLDEPQLQTLATDMGAQISDTAAEYLKQDRLRRHGREIWRYLLMALLVFMFLELVLQQRFSRVRT